MDKDIQREALLLYYQVKLDLLRDMRDYFDKGFTEPLTLVVSAGAHKLGSFTLTHEDHRATSSLLALLDEWASGRVAILTNRF